MNGVLDHAMWERIAQGSPLIVMILMAALVMLWRYLVMRQGTFDQTMQVRQSSFDEAMKAERDALRLMQIETLRALTGMQTSVDRNTEATRELTSAIRSRAP